MASNCKEKNEDENVTSDLNVANLNDAKSLDDTLRCPICFDYFDNCMMTKCSHNYCSVCIRRYMLYKAQCPTCFQEASEPELRNNRLIDEVLHIYLKSKGNPPKATAEIVKPTQSQPVFVQIETEPAPSSSSSNIHKSSSSKTHEYDDVTCPVCYRVVSLQKINLHLDNCLKSNDVEEEPERLRSLPKLVYHLLSDKDIKKKLREHGLSVSGDRQTLIRRHKNFLVLYNANCDSLNPKSASEIVEEFELQELEEKLNSIPKQSQVNKKSEISMIEKERRTYLREHQSQFNELIQNIHERQFERSIKKEIPENEDSYLQFGSSNEAILISNASVKEESDSDETDKEQDFNSSDNLDSNCEATAKKWLCVAGGRHIARHHPSFDGIPVQLQEAVKGEIWRQSK